MPERAGGAVPAPLTRLARWRATSRALAVRHGLAFTLFVVTPGVLLRPMMAAGSPPGVDTPTFLHLAWVVERAFLGALDNPLTDPYWYGGWPYARAYPPLAYGLVGVLSALTPLPIEIAYRVVTFAAFVGLGLTAYTLALELGGRRLWAVVAGLLTLTAHPIFLGVGIFGWFSTLVSLPFGIAGFAALERATRTGSRRAALWAGALFGLCVLAHHMTGFALAIGLVPWALYHLAFPAAGRRRILRAWGWVTVAGLVVCGVWAVFFITLLLDVGFEREVPGNWRFNFEAYRLRMLSRTFIAREIYPSYLGVVHLPLAFTGVFFALVTRPRVAPAALALLTLAWFSMGTAANPLVRYYPFSGLDVARFAFFMVPFMGVVGAASADAAMTELRWMRRPRWLLPAVGLALAGALLFVPVEDGVRASKTLAPITAIPQVDLAMAWLAQETPKDATVLAMGFRNWDAYWVPERAGRAVMDGWNDEGAKNWRLVREVRHMGWFGRVNGLRLYEIMRDLDADYLVIYHWDPLDSPHLFELVASEDAFLFRPRVSWPGVAIYERIAGAV